jgi:lipopolysaccharide transport system permease protein
MIATGVPSLATNISLVTKVKMPRQIIPMGVALANLVDFGVASLVLVGMFLFYQITLNWTILWVIPLLAIQTLLALGVVLLGSALNVLYRDIRFIVPLAMQLWMYASPVIYPVELVPERWRLLYFLNPMAAVIDNYRRVLILDAAPDFIALILALAISVLLFVLGFWVFRKLEPSFADII